MLLPARVIKWVKADAYSLRNYPECEFDEFHKDALVRELVANKYVICGDTHQCPDYPCVPVFHDGYLMLSMRRWAEVMHDAYLHINVRQWPEPWFYMACTCCVEENLPRDEEDQ